MSQEEENKPADTVSHFESEDMKVSMRKNPYCEVELDIEVKPEAVNKFKPNALKDAKKEVSLPGFRKGKAPDEVVKRNFPKLIEQCLKDVLVRNYFTKAAELTKEPIQSEEEIRLKKSELQEDGSFTFSLDFETQMHIPTVNPQDIKLAKQEVKAVTEEDVMNELNNLQYEHGTWTDVTERPIAEGDFVRVQIDRIEADGNLTPIETGQNLVQVKPERMFKELHEALLGKSLNETFEVVVKGEPKEGEEQPSTHTFRVNVLQHQFCEPHALNDELASHQKVENLEELKKRIDSFLKKKREDQIKTNLAEQLEAILFKDYYFDIRRSILLNMVKEFQQNLKDAGQYDPKNIESIIRSAIFNAHRIYLLGSIYNEHHLELSQEDLKASLNRYVWNHYQTHGTFPSDILDGSGNMTLIQETAKQDKVIDFLLANATYE